MSKKLIYLALLTVLLVVIALPVYAIESDHSRTTLVGSLTSGTWFYDDGEWVFLTPSTTGAMVGDELYLYVSYASGIWVYDSDFVEWTHLTPSTATAMAIVDGELVVSVASGTWVYDGVDWERLTPSTTNTMVGDGGALYVSYRSGIWKYEADEWTHLTPSTATAMAIVDGELVVSVASGTWFYDGVEWERLTPSTTNAMVGDEGALYVSYRSGLWEYVEEEWTHLTSSTARSLAVFKYYPFHRVAALLPKTGVLKEYAETNEAAADLARRDLNSWLKSQDEDWRLMLLVCDTKLNHEVALNRLKNRNQQGVKFFLGPMASGEVAHVLDYANAHELLLVSPSSTAVGLNTAQDWLYRFCYDDSYDPEPEPVLGAHSYRDHVASHILTKLGREPDTYAYNAYDIIWSLGLSFFEEGYDPDEVRAVLPDTAEDWSEDYGASGWIILNEAGDRIPPEIR